MEPNLEPLIVEVVAATVDASDEEITCLLLAGNVVETELVITLLLRLKVKDGTDFAEFAVVTFALAIVFSFCTLLE